MKHSVLAILVITLICSPAFARLGEDETTVGFRYDDPVGQEDVPDYDKKLLYHDPPYSLAVTFKAGRAVIITYQLEKKEQMSIWRIEQILQDNARKEGGWKSVWFFSDNRCKPGEISFINELQNAVAVYNLENETLTIRYQEKPKPAPGSTADESSMPGLKY